MINKIEGVGKNAPIVINSKGGKQSEVPMAIHLIDPSFLSETFSNLAEELEYCDEGNSIVVDDKDNLKYGVYRAIERIADYMISEEGWFLTSAMEILNCDDVDIIISIAKVLKEGAERYTPNNWRLIPQEEHINHALIHLIAFLKDDTQDDHYNHALTRLMMARVTKKSENFSYTKYVEVNTKERT